MMSGITSYIEYLCKYYDMNIFISNFKKKAIFLYNIMVLLRCNDVDIGYLSDTIFEDLTKLVLS